MSEKRGPQRSVKTGIYYERPEGVMFKGFDKEGMGYRPMILVGPAFDSLTFKKQSSRPATWYFGSAQGAVNPVTDEYIDADGNFLWSLSPSVMGEFYYLPILKSDYDEFQYGAKELNLAYPEDNFPGFIMADSVTALTYADEHIANSYYFSRDGFLFGSGGGYAPDMGLEGDDTWTFTGILQNFERPASPLYVEDIVLNAVSLDTDKPIPAGKELTMTIADTKGNILHVLTATPSDLITDPGSQLTQWGEAWLHKVVFTKKDIDPITNLPAPEPFVLTDSCEITVSGLDIDGVNIGFTGMENADENVLMLGYTVARNEEGKITYLYYGGGNGMSIPFTFTGLFDAIHVWDSGVIGGTEYKGLNVLRVSADGKEAHLDNMKDMEGVQVSTATRWFDEDQNEYYSIAGDYPEWIEGLIIDNSSWNSETNPGANLISVSCSPLSAGETGRQAVLYLQGRGVTSATPIIVLQGDAVYDGITDVEQGSAVKAGNAVYNMRGQRVNKSAKGILIKDGKKFISK